MAYEKIGWEDAPSKKSALNAANLKHMDEGIEEVSLEVEKLPNEILDMVYPVGAIYLSVNSTSPAALFGGKWTQIKDTFLLAAGSTYAAGATGGEASHTLTKSEMPAHSHSYTDTEDVGLTGYGTGNFDLVKEGYEITLLQSRIESGSTGGGSAHNNMPPYLAVYMWKRTE